jgi:hypothetical protein
MEFLFGLLLLFFGGFVIRLIFRALGAAGRTAIGKGSLSENLELSFKGMPPLEAVSVRC